MCFSTSVMISVSKSTVSTSSCCAAIAPRLAKPNKVALEPFEEEGDVFEVARHVLRVVG